MCGSALQPEPVRIGAAQPPSVDKLAHGPGEFGCAITAVPAQFGKQFGPRDFEPASARHGLLQPRAKFRDQPPKFIGAKPNPVAVQSHTVAPVRERQRLGCQFSDGVRIPKHPDGKGEQPWHAHHGQQWFRNSSA